MIVLLKKEVINDLVLNKRFISLFLFNLIQFIFLLVLDIEAE